MFRSLQFNTTLWQRVRVYFIWHIIFSWFTCNRIIVIGTWSTFLSLFYLGWQKNTHSVCWYTFRILYFFTVLRLVTTPSALVDSSDERLWLEWPLRLLLFPLERVNLRNSRFYTFYWIQYKRNYEIFSDQWNHVFYKNCYPFTSLKFFNFASLLIRCVAVTWITVARFMLSLRNLRPFLTSRRLQLFSQLIISEKVVRKIRSTFTSVVKSSSPLDDFSDASGSACENWSKLSFESLSMFLAPFCGISSYYQYKFHVSLHYWEILIR